MNAPINLEKSTLLKTLNDNYHFKESNVLKISIDNSGANPIKIVFASYEKSIEPNQQFVLGNEFYPENFDFKIEIGDAANCDLIYECLSEKLNNCD